MGISRLAAAFASKIGENLFERRKALRVHQFQKAEFEMKPRVGPAAQIVVSGEQQIEEAREIFFGKARSLFGETRALVHRRGDKIGIGAANARDQKIAQMANRFAAEMLEILAVGDEPVNQAERAFSGLRRNGINQVVEDAFGYDAEQFARLSV